MVAVTLQTDVFAPAAFSGWAAAVSSIPRKAMLVFYHFFRYLRLPRVFLVHAATLNLIITVAVTTTSPPSCAVPSAATERNMCPSHCGFGSCNFDLICYSVDGTQALRTVLPPIPVGVACEILPHSVV